MKPPRVRYEVKQQGEWRPVDSGREIRGGALWYEIRRMEGRRLHSGIEAWAGPGEWRKVDPTSQVPEK